MIFKLILVKPKKNFLRETPQNNSGKLPKTTWRNSTKQLGETPPKKLGEIPQNNSEKLPKTTRGNSPKQHGETSQNKTGKVPEW